MTPNEEHLSIAELFLLFYYKDGKLYNRITRNSRAVIGAEVGCNDGHDYLDVSVNKRKYKVHRIIWAMHNGRWPEGNLVIDHINRIKSDNHKENLREATTQQNAWNNKAKGYCYSKGNWRAHIMANGKRYSGKRRETEEEAIQDKADLVKKYRG